MSRNTLVSKIVTYFISVNLRLLSDNIFYEKKIYICVYTLNQQDIFALFCALDLIFLHFLDKRSFGVFLNSFYFDQCNKISIFLNVTERYFTPLKTR